MIFHFYGHPNVLCKHYNTLEFTKDSDLTREGDCILGVRADFDIAEIKKIVSKHTRARVIITSGSLKEEINMTLNKAFDDDYEIVIRRSGYLSKRTFGIHSDKAAKDISRSLAEKLKSPETKASVEIVGI